MAVLFEHNRFYFCCSETSSDAKLGHIISDGPEIIECFGPFNIRHPLSGGPAEVHDVSACAPAAFNHGSALFIQSHLEAFSAASVLLRMALLLLSPVMPRAV